jgi:putative ABC transport system permease protein
MKASIYFSYPTSSLIRGGQRSLLAIFCVAVGVMSLVALQLVGGMLQSTLTSNTRATNGGDIAVAAQAKPFTTSDLTFFNQRKSAGTILNYTAVLNQTSSLNSVSITSGTGGGVRASASSDAFQLDAVDPGNYPLVGEPDFVTPASGKLSTLLTNKQVVVTQTFITSTKHKVGDTITGYIRSSTGTAQAFHVTIAGVISNTGGFSESSSLMLISQAEYKTQLSPKSALTYSNVYVTTTDQAQTDATVKALNQHFTQASTQTATDALKEEQSSIDNVNEFLEIAGLLALLIGGVGIVNTMQVLLSRRKTEIAMLKTAGYRRIDLYALFGLEAGLLGLIGGMIGAAASIGVSAIVRILVQNLGFSVPYVINPATVAGGVIIGIATSLIFGLLPIVQAANIRPLNVIRDTGEKRGVGSTILSIALLILLSILFCVLAIVILNNNVVLGIEAVYGTFAFLLLLSGLFSLVVLVVSKLPVRNHFSYLHLLLTVLGLVLAVLLYRIAPVFGYVIFCVTILGLLLIVAPRSWQVSTRLALRNIGRQRSRTTTTMVALFIGIFAIGLVLLLGQDLQAQINTTLAQNLTYNVIVLTTGKDSQALHTQIGEISGLKKSLVDTYTQAKIKTVNGKALETVKPSTSSTKNSTPTPARKPGGIFGGFGGGGGKSGNPSAPTATTDTSLGSSLEGYDLSKNIPDVTIAQGYQGRRYHHS